MKQKKTMYVLGFYNFILAAGAVGMGIMMLISKFGIFVEYPKEWVSKTPFDSWFVFGIISILVFGIGNLIATILCYKKSYVFSIVMGSLLLFSLVTQIIVLDEWYLATLELLVLCLIQLFLSVYSHICKKKH